jgi:hypothetical protein
LAGKLVAKISPWVAAKSSGEGDVSAVEAEWTVEADELASASYGYQLITTIGKVRRCYQLSMSPVVSPNS